MVIAEVSIIPMGTKTPSVSKHLARALTVLESEKDIKYEITPMGTIIEGDLDNVLSLVRKMHEGVFNEEIMRAVTTIKIDDRRDKPSTMSAKIESLKKELEH